MKYITYTIGLSCGIFHSSLEDCRYTDAERASRQCWKDVDKSLLSIMHSPVLFNELGTLLSLASILKQGVEQHLQLFLHVPEQEMTLAWMLAGV